jgi:hypothetical protein
MDRSNIILVLFVFAVIMTSVMLALGFMSALEQSDGPVSPRSSVQHATVSFNLEKPYDTPEEMMGEAT